MGCWVVGLLVLASPHDGSFLVGLDGLLVVHVRNLGCVVVRERDKHQHEHRDGRALDEGTVPRGGLDSEQLAFARK